MNIPFAKNIRSGLGMCDVADEPMGRRVGTLWSRTYEQVFELCRPRARYLKWFASAQFDGADGRV